MATEDNIRNRDTIQRSIDQWYPLATRSVRTFATLLDENLDQKRDTPPLQRTGEALDRCYRDYLGSMNLAVTS